MKSKLINKQTGEKHICEKVTIDGMDYYVSEEQIKIGDKGWLYEDGYIKSLCEFDCTKGLNGIRISDRKVIATNNPNIDIPKVVDEVERLAESIIPNLLYKKYVKTGFIGGYNKSQETHPFSEEDMIEFLGFVEKTAKLSFESTGENTGKTYKELLQLWKEQQPKIVYYE